MYESWMYQLVSELNITHLNAADLILYKSTYGKR